MTISDHLKQVTIIYLALIGGQIAICTILVLVNQGAESVGSSIFNYIAPVLSIGTITLAFIMKNRHNAEAKQLQEQGEKLEHHRRSSLISWALLEGGNLTMVIFFFLENNYLYLLLFALGMVSFSFLRPTAKELKEVYGLKE